MYRWKFLAIPLMAAVTAVIFIFSQGKQQAILSTDSMYLLGGAASSSWSTDFKRLVIQRILTVLLMLTILIIAIVLRIVSNGELHQVTLHNNNYQYNITAS